MTPKEKAEELVDKFWYVEPKESCDGMEYHIAQQCALIAVDEVLYVLNEIDSTKQWNASYFYNQVKQEINNL